MSTETKTKGGPRWLWRFVGRLKLARRWMVDPSLAMERREKATTLREYRKARDRFKHAGRFGLGFNFNAVMARNYRDMFQVRRYSPNIRSQP